MSVNASSIAINGATTAVRERQGLWLMVGGGLLLGTVGIFIEEAGAHPLTAVWFRCLFGAMALLAWGAATGRTAELRLSGRSLLAALAAGALVMLNWSLFFAAIPRTSIAVATVAFHIQPLWLLALGAWWLREPVTSGQCMSVLIALLGLVLATGLLDEAQRGVAVTPDYGVGLAMCIGGSLTYAVVTLIAKCATGVTPFALAWWQCAFGIVALAWWPWLNGWPASGSTWAWLAGLGIIHTGFAYMVLYAGMARLSAGRIAVLQFVYPAAAVLVDWVVYGRALGTVQLLGVLLMGAALWGLKRPVARRSA